MNECNIVLYSIIGWVGKSSIEYQRQGATKRYEKIKTKLYKNGNSVENIVLITLHKIPIYRDIRN